MKRIWMCLLALCLLTSSLCAVADERVYDVPLSSLSLTTGLETDKADQIMVAQMDNEPGARPQKGIASADIVYEIEVYNGGYTRYTAVFNDTIPNEIEAVRSTRIVNIDFYLEYGGCFIHFGGQQYEGSNIYDYVKTVNMQARFDGLSDSTNFYRDSNRKAPNNVVARFSQIYNQVNWDSTTASSPLHFSAANFTQGDEAANQFSIPYRETSYLPSYVYNPNDGLYYRYYNGERYVDGYTGEQVTCSNVIVQYMTYDWYNGASDAPKVTTVGSNRCDYFINGTHFTGTWVRDSLTSNTIYYDEAGNEVLFKPGKTFIQTLKDTKEVTIAG